MPIQPSNPKRYSPAIPADTRVVTRERPDGFTKSRTVATRGIFPDLKTLLDRFFAIITPPKFDPGELGKLGYLTVIVQKTGDSNREAWIEIDGQPKPILGFNVRTTYPLEAGEHKVALHQAGTDPQEKIVLLPSGGGSEVILYAK